jgi:hypothetical protein
MERARQLQGPVDDQMPKRHTGRASFEMGRELGYTAIEETRRLFERDDRYGTGSARDAHFLDAECQRAGKEKIDQGT